MTPQIKHMGLAEVVFEVRRRSLAKAREERIEFNTGERLLESGQEWGAGQDEETVTLIEPILSGRL